MNDSPYGLTASIWTNAEGNFESEEVFLRFVDELETGTVFLNRCVDVISTEYTGLLLLYPDVIIWILPWHGQE
jgi:acyl-CoA reductase-like NAD-dependent aldehyde dehydrogenase